MTDTPDPDEITADERELLGVVGDALGADPLPEGLVERSELLVTWFDVDDELVALLQEATEELIGTRGGASSALVFATADGVLEVDLDIDNAERRVVGHLTVGDADTARLVRSDSTEIAEASIDEVGRFEFISDRSGPHRIEFNLSLGNPVVTDWFVL